MIKQLACLLTLCALNACSDNTIDSRAQTSAEPAVVAVYDTVLRGALLFNGDDEPPVEGDLAIHGGLIAAVGELGEFTATDVIDVSGLAITPGFIDIHSHALDDNRDQGIFGWPDAENLIRQGVTTVIGGNDGDSPLPLSDTFDAIATLPAAVNFGSYIGHGSIRGLIVGEDDEVLVVLGSGKVVRSSVNEVPAKGRDTMGVVFARMDEEDTVLGIARNQDRDLDGPEEGSSVDEEPPADETISDKLHMSSKSRF
jgi:dihydroorotase-like cyclic amidohydrolase